MQILPEILVENFFCFFFRFVQMQMKEKLRRICSLLLLSQRHSVLLGFLVSLCYFQPTKHITKLWLGFSLFLTLSRFADEPLDIFNTLQFVNFT